MVCHSSVKMKRSFSETYAKKKKLCSYVILSKIKIKKHENHLKHHSFHLYRTCLARHVPTRTSNHSIPFTRLVAIPKSQLRLARLATQP